MGKGMGGKGMGTGDGMAISFPCPKFACHLRSKRLPHTSFAVGLAARLRPACPRGLLRTRMSSGKGTVEGYGMTQKATNVGEMGQDS